MRGQRRSPRSQRTSTTTSPIQASRHEFILLSSARSPSIPCRTSSALASILGAGKLRETDSGGQHDTLQLINGRVLLKNLIALTAVECLSRANHTSRHMCASIRPPPFQKNDSGMRTKTCDFVLLNDTTEWGQDSLAHALRAQLFLRLFRISWQFPTPSASPVLLLMPGITSFCESVGSKYAPRAMWRQILRELTRGEVKCPYEADWQSQAPRNRQKQVSKGSLSVHQSLLSINTDCNKNPHPARIPSPASQPSRSISSSRVMSCIVPTHLSQ